MIPIATTTITIEGATETEPGEGRTWSTKATGVRAVIGQPSGSENHAPGGGRELTRHRLDCDVTDISHTDRVTDETTGDVYEVEWVKKRIGLGLNHMVGVLTLTEGAAA